MKIALELDMCFEQDEDDSRDYAMYRAIREVHEYSGVDVYVVQEHGPGGGWPLVCIAGELPQVIKALTGVPGWNMDAEEALEVLAAG